MIFKENDCFRIQNPDYLTTFEGMQTRSIKFFPLFFPVLSFRAHCPTKHNNSRAEVFDGAAA
jgi:hypothetical protein